MNAMKLASEYDIEEQIKIEEQFQKMKTNRISNNQQEFNQYQFKYEKNFNY